MRVNYANTNSAWTAAQPVINPDDSVTAAIMRGPQDKLYLVASAVPASVAAIRIYVNPILNGFEYPIIQNYNWAWQLQIPGVTPSAIFDVPVSRLTNGVFEMASSNFPPYGAYQFETQGIGVDGNVGKFTCAYVVQDQYGDFVPFLDGRTQIQQNIHFQLRSATAQYPFAFNIDTTVYGGGFYWTHSAPTNYVVAGYYGDTYYPYYPFQCNEFQPFEENYFYANWLYSTNNVSGSGLVTGVLYADNHLYQLEHAPSYLFPTYDYVTNATHPAIAGVLPDAAARWIYYSSTDGSDAADIGLNPAGVGQLTVSNACHNLYGLGLNSILYPTGDDPAYALAHPGDTVAASYPNNFGDWFFEFATPVLSTVGYYFPRPGLDPQPSEGAFSVTNTTIAPLMILFGQPFLLSAWAKQSLLNGYSGVYAYPQQYFDKAFLPGTNGNISTNQTGILSEYGNFFPTQAGKVFLTTKPDADTGSTGQCPVYVLKMQLDVNHDGIMDTSFAGPDNTSADRPFRFWVNSDSDVSAGYISAEHDVDDPNQPDYSLRNIPSQRDLEDWNRLWICGLPVLPTNYQVTLSWNVISGNPAINLVKPYETNGGTLYLTDTNIAAGQSGGNSFFTPSYKFANVTPGNSYIFPYSYLTGDTTNCFLFEGAGVGKGELVLTISADGTNIMSTSVFMDLKEVKDMFEHAHVENTPSPPVYSAFTDQSTFKNDNYVLSNLNEGTNLIVFVHGWRVTPWTAENFAQTMFKRLWWQGYQGRFAALRWPTLSSETDGPLPQFLTFNRDEFIAFNCAQGATGYFLQLKSRFPNYNIDVCAHSHGNILMMEVLRDLLASGQKPIHNYALLQAAVAAECLDTNAPTYNDFTFGDTIPDSFYGYAGPVNTAVSGKMVNFYNTNDFGVVVCWQPDQLQTKPDGRYSYQYIFGIPRQTPTGSSRTITDPHELMAFLSRPKTQAVGAMPNLGGALSTADQIDLTALVGFTDHWNEHSGEFNWNIQALHPFYLELLDKLQ